MNVIQKVTHRLNQIKSLSVYGFDLIQERMTDFSQLQHYDQANTKLIPDFDRVIFFGDSITDFWDLQSYFQNQSYVNRGIAGQTTPQMLIRFRSDAIALRPKAVILLAGTNDIAGNTGSATIAQIQDNLMSIVELAKYHQIRVILASLLPVSELVSATRPLDKIAALNDWIQNYCAENDCVYLDYHSQMVDDRGFLQSHLSVDGLHPNDAGYKIMAPLAEAAIQGVI
ncbi:capsular biosynthesis protein [Cyanobacteria bacterium FACHB-DQ100]|uniref:GDSL-type esterase/lipase family protein n=1 Tax=Leptolyngbya sp. DQ-M1 TaxID=2933920 RepID=UPI0019BA48A3|nr:capsular biosynthesis protein [Cyanobacteria bacterium FACHB-DQ100]